MVSCPFCGVMSRLVRGKVEMFGVAVDAEHHACTACGEEFFTFAQAQAAEKLALAVLDEREGRAAVPARRGHARARVG